MLGIFSDRDGTENGSGKYRCLLSDTGHYRTKFNTVPIYRGLSPEQSIRRRAAKNFR